ncbi:glycosyltransferase family 1 protein [Azospirillum thermophilum]|uniref:Glycosyl transferase n=1 Tax=Azospirillum thermophilum TaxID=2202148 RepID=A0A2S2CW99_9PROT|nr:glycosyltransferase family 1 protein [Azospirillum thermophilum]AWK88746.1 glycosyl transferase [Azospirillum thermophilum]
MEYADKSEVLPIEGSPPPSGRTRRPSDFICFSHLRWGFVHQRPQHLMERFAREFRLFYVEEPVEADIDEPGMVVYDGSAGIRLLVPQLPRGMSGREAEVAQRRVLERKFAELGIRNPVLWYYNPMAPQFADHLAAAAVVYDCMDELSAFRGAPPELVERERGLLQRADVVFTGGYSLYEAKRDRHPNVHPFPSSVDVKHFAAARDGREPADQADLPRPRLGFYGVIDERLDLELLDAAARLRPDWQFVILGPVVKIDPAALPQAPNISYPGMRGYGELPAYLAGWDVALMPFALNESTRFISPTKTPEYLAAGCPVVSTPITDVVRTYGDSGLVWIADTPEAFVAACEEALKVDRHAPDWLGAIDRVLGDMSWDTTWGRMKTLVDSAC